MQHHLWLIDPFDPLIVADGRPFNPDPGARATSRLFPPPSVTTGGLRTRLGWERGGSFTTLKVELVNTPVGGPLLVRLDHDESVIAAWYAPAPADAVIRVDEGQITRYRLQPLDPAVFSPAWTDIHQPAATAALQLVAADQDIKGKAPPSGVPHWWSWRMFTRWLLAPATSAFDLAVLHATSDLVTIQRDTRTHVQIDKATQRADEGMLFQTQGLSFYGTDHDPSARFALAVWSTGTFASTVAPLGGERRLVEWRKSPSALPTCPDAVLESIITAKACRIILLTPAFWDNGAVPAALPAHRLGGVQVVAVANQRPEIISGWDFDLNRPKPSRRHAPAGTVLFVRLDGDAAAIAAWVQAMWLQPLNDDAQASRDGFGIAVLGCWDGRDLKEIRDAHTP